MDEKRQLRVFLCHSSADRPMVRDLNKLLVKESWIDPWLDEIKIKLGKIGSLRLKMQLIKQMW